MLTKKFIGIQDAPSRNTLVITKDTNTDISANINVKCSLQEIVNIFCVTDTKMLNIAMKELYGKHFISSKKQIIKDNTLLKECIFLTGKWKYIKSWEHIDDIGIIITMKSTDDSDIKADIIYNISIINTEYTIKKDMYFNITFAAVTFNTVAIKYIRKLVRGLEVVPKIIISNRIILQQFIDISRCIIDNKYCTNCANRFKTFFGVFHESTLICHLCGYNVCRKCILKHKIYQNDNYEDITICKKCIIRLDNLDYSTIDLNLNPYTRIISDPLDYNAGHNMYDYLVKESITNDHARFILSLILKNNFDPKDFKQRNQLLRILISTIPLDECIVSTHFKRDYKVDIDKNPILLPLDEQERITAVNKIDYNACLKNPLLMFICNAITCQLKSLLTIILLIEDKSNTVIACNNPEVIKRYNRNESICQHIVMTKKPLLINNPEADVKYGCIPGISDYQSYFGIPIIIDNQVIGSFCILGQKPRIITQSEFSLMMKFSEIISKIL